MRYVFTVCLLLWLPLALNAQGCKEILDKLPRHSGDSNVFAKQVENYKKACKERPSSEDPEKLKDCIDAGMRSLGVAGNYVAAEEMAVRECNNGNEQVSKNWLGMVIKNNNASEEERAIANQVINGPTQ
ncbi:MAG: hypothetical protein AB7I18_06375 [Candidatus Berkiella sp.]